MWRSGMPSSPPWGSGIIADARLRIGGDESGSGRESLSARFWIHREIPARLSRSHLGRFNHNDLPGDTRHLHRHGGPSAAIGARRPSGCLTNIGDPGGREIDENPTGPKKPKDWYQTRDAPALPDLLSRAMRPCLDDGASTPVRTPSRAMSIWALDRTLAYLATTIEGQGAWETVATISGSSHAKPLD